MGDVPIIVGALVGSSIVYSIILIYLTVKTKTTPRPDLDKGGEKR